MRTVKRAVVLLLLVTSVILFCWDAISINTERGSLEQASESVEEALDQFRDSTDKLEDELQYTGVHIDLHSFQKDFDKICGSALDGKIGYAEAYINLNRTRNALRAFRNIERTMTVEDVEIDLKETEIDPEKLQTLRAAGVEINGNKMRINSSEMIDNIMPRVLAPVMKIIKAIEGLINFIAFIFFMVLLVGLFLGAFAIVSVVRGKTGPIGYTIYASLAFLVTLALTGFMTAIVRTAFQPVGRLSIGIAPTFWLMELTAILTSVLYGVFQSQEKKAAREAARRNMMMNGGGQYPYAAYPPPQPQRVMGPHIPNPPQNTYMPNGAPNGQMQYRPPQQGPYGQNPGMQGRTPMGPPQQMQPQGQFGICKNCGRPLMQGAAFCTVCGLRC